jgi:hypothetical protein
MGGVDRSLADGNQLGFHQFYRPPSADLTSPGSLADNAEVPNLSHEQLLFGIIATYLVEMGVDARLLLIAAAGAPDQIIYLSGDELSKLRVTTPIGFGPWFLEPFRDGLVAASRKHRQSHPYDLVDQVTVYCRVEDNISIILLSVGGDWRPTLAENASAPNMSRNTLSQCSRSSGGGLNRSGSMPSISSRTPRSISRKSVSIDGAPWKASRHLRPSVRMPQRTRRFDCTSARDR